jgi:hypothetical protein
VTTLLAVPLLALLLPPTNAVGRASHVPHVRVRHAGVAPYLRDAIDGSAAIRRMVAILDASDVIVYFELQPALPLTLRAGVSFAGAGGRFRYLRVALNPGNTRGETLAMIGHELQHAVEIAAAPEVRSTAALRRFYKRIGMAGGTAETWDTQAAREMGRRVTREIERKY